MKDLSKRRAQTLAQLKSPRFDYYGPLADLAFLAKEDIPADNGGYIVKTVAEPLPKHGPVYIAGLPRLWTRYAQCAFVFPSQEEAEQFIRDNVDEVGECRVIPA
jgi:hypothetical protein